MTDMLLHVVLTLNYYFAMKVLLNIRESKVHEKDKTPTHTKIMHNQLHFQNTQWIIENEKRSKHRSTSTRSNCAGTK